MKSHHFLYLAMAIGTFFLISIVSSCFDHPLVNPADPKFFTKHLIDDSFYSALAVYAEDLDGDGDIDVLGTVFNDDEIAWWENDGSEIFTKHTIDESFYGTRAVYAEDVDGDGDIDVLGAAFNNDEIAWWENDGSEIFTKHTVDGNFDVARALYAEDVDGDGDIDVLGAGNYAIAWWENPLY